MNIGEVLEAIEGDRYINLKTYDLTELAKNVNELMQHGWKPAGGMILEEMSDTRGPLTIYHVPAYPPPTSIVNSELHDHALWWKISM